MPTIRSDLPKAIRNHRKAVNLTQEELANRCRLSRNYICQIESGRKAPSIDALNAIAKALDANLSDLVGEDYIIKELREKINITAASEVLTELRSLIRRP